MDIDYDKVIEYAQYDDRLGKSHWAVPGPDGSFGFSGHCFPKDTQALMYKAFNLGLTPTILAATLSKNDEVRDERDWEGMEGRAVIKTNNFETLDKYESLEDMRQGIESHIAGSADIEFISEKEMDKLENENGVEYVDPNQLKLNLKYSNNGIS